MRAYVADLPKLEPLLARIKTPVLVVAGRNDPIVPPANGKFLAEHLPHNRYALLDGAHRIWEDAAEQYADALAAWFAGDYRAVGP